MTSSPSTPQLRNDTVSGRWVIFSPARAKRPSDFKSISSNPNPNPNSDHQCPFCSGNEHLCAPEIFRLPPTRPDWHVRVIQNLYPALSRLDSASPRCSESGSESAMALDGVGFHDVVIESPIHSDHLSDLSPGRIGDVLLAYKARIEQIGDYDSIKYVQVFKNHGASAGASLSHSHSQMLALPIVPPSVSTRLSCMKEYFDRTKQCSICQLQRDDLLIDSSTHFVSIAPFASSFPFEIWIIPRDHSPHFHEIDADKSIDLGGQLKLMLRKLALQLDDPPFNFMIQTSPLRVNASERPYSH